MPGPDEIDDIERRLRIEALNDAKAREDAEIERARAEEEKLPGLSAEELAAIDDDDGLAPGNTFAKPAPPAAPSVRLQAGAAAMTADKAESILDAQIINPLGVIIRGLMVSAPGVPADVLFRSISRCYARLVGEAFAGDLAPVFQVRASIREAFERELKRQPVKPVLHGQGGPGMNGSRPAPRG